MPPRSRTVLPAGLTAHSRPGVAFPILLAIIASQGLCLALAAAFRPFLSAFLNFLEVTCGALDVATLVITAVVYRHRQAAQEEAAAGAAPGQGPHGQASFAKVSWQHQQMAARGAAGPDLAARQRVCASVTGACLHACTMCCLPCSQAEAVAAPHGSCRELASGRELALDTALQIEAGVLLWCSG